MNMPTVFNFAQTKQINKKENKNREQADGSTAKIKRFFFVLVFGNATVNLHTQWVNWKRFPEYRPYNGLSL